MAALKMPVALRRLARDTHAAEIVEFALVLPMVLFVFAGIIDMGFLFTNYQTLTNAAREGARVAVVPGWADTDVTDRVNQYLQADGMDPAAANTVATPVQINVGAGSINGVKVVVTYPYNFMVLGPIAQLVKAAGSYDTVTLTAVATMRTEIAAGL